MITDEWYAEFYAPIISPDMDIPLVYSASVEGAFRQVDNSIAGKDDVHTQSVAVGHPSRTSSSVATSPVLSGRLPLLNCSCPCQVPSHLRLILVTRPMWGSGPAPANRRANCVAAGIDVEQLLNPIVRNASVQGRKRR